MFYSRASHGTTFLSPVEIKEEYGNDRHWPEFESLISVVNNVGGEKYINILASKVYIMRHTLGLQHRMLYVLCANAKHCAGLDVVCVVC